ncbi:MAG: hypothetical protein ABH986_05160 [archaeon]
MKEAKEKKVLEMHKKKIHQKVIAKEVSLTQQRVSQIIQTNK